MINRPAMKCSCYKSSRNIIIHFAVWAVFATFFFLHVSIFRYVFELSNTKQIDKKKIKCKSSCIRLLSILLCCMRQFFYVLIKNCINKYVCINSSIFFSSLFSFYTDRTLLLCCMRWTNIRSISSWSWRLYMAWIMFTVLHLPVAIGPSTVLLFTWAPSLL